MIRFFETHYICVYLLYFPTYDDLLADNLRFFAVLAIPVSFEANVGQGSQGCFPVRRAWTLVTFKQLVSLTGLLAGGNSVIL